MDRTARYRKVSSSLSSQARHKLPLHTEKAIRTIYGPTKSVELDDIKRVSTPEEAFHKAQEELDHYKRKGFYKDAFGSKRWSPFISNSILNEQIGPRQIDLARLFEKEPYQVFFFNTDLMQDIIIEISSLPYRWKGDERTSINRLYDIASSVVRLLKHDNYLNDDINSEKQKSRAMAIFVTKIRGFRCKLMNDLIKEGKLFNNNLTFEQKREFKTSIPENNMNRKDISPISNKYSEADRQLYQHIIRDTNNLPETYKIRPEELDEDSRAINLAQTTKLLNVLPSEISNEMRPALEKPPIRECASGLIPRENLITHKTRILAAESQTQLRFDSLTKKEDEENKNQLNDEQIHSFYWNNSDPLGESRQGKTVDSLNYLQRISSNFEFNQPTFEGKVDVPFSCEINEDDEFPDVSYDEQKPHSQTSARVPKESELRINKRNKDNIMLTAANLVAVNADYRRTQASDIQFLLRQTYLLMQDKTSNDRLSQIWTELGFTIKQKLDLLLKYTSDTDETQKFIDSISYWEQALEVSNSYNNVYQKYKDFLKFDSSTSPHVRKLIDEHEMELRKAEGSLIQMAATMKKALGDDLIIKRKKVNDLLNWHRVKLNQMKANLLF